MQKSDSLYGSANAACDDCQIEGEGLAESVVVFISQCLLLVVCNAANGLKESRIFGNLCAFFENRKVFCQSFVVSKVGDVLQERLWCMVCERIFNSMPLSLASAFD